MKTHYLADAAARDALPARHEPYWVLTGPQGCGLGYRKPATGAAAWKARVRKGGVYIHTTLAADDYPEALAAALAFFDQHLPKAAPRPAPRVTLRPTAVYFHRDRAGKLLYIGASSEVGRRTAAHARIAPWAMHIARIDLEWHDTVEGALRAEAAAIAAHKPPYNKRGRVRHLDN